MYPILISTFCRTLKRQGVGNCLEGEGIGHPWPRPGIIAVEPRESKLARAHAVTPLFQAGNVYLPKDAPWLFDYEDELTKFPNAVHDDQVDATTQGLSQAMNTFSMWDVI